MIIVTSLKDHVNVCESIKPNYLISVIDPGFVPPTPKGVKYHLKLGFDDITELTKSNFIHRAIGSFANVEINKQILPDNNHINKIVNFVSSWDRLEPIVIHCWCGVSRSMATAVYILCKVAPENIEKNVRYIRSIAPHANPNTLMITLFEKNLGLDGLINKTFKKYPYTITYDCETTFAPICIFKINDLKKFE